MNNGLYFIVNEKWVESALELNLYMIKYENKIKEIESKMRLIMRVRVDQI